MHKENCPNHGCPAIRMSTKQTQSAGFHNKDMTRTQNITPSIFHHPQR